MPDYKALVNLAAKRSTAVRQKRAPSARQPPAALNPFTLTANAYGSGAHSAHFEIDKGSVRNYLGCLVGGDPLTFDPPTTEPGTGAQRSFARLAVPVPNQNPLRLSVTIRYLPQPPNGTTMAAEVVVTSGAVGTVVMDGDTWEKELAKVLGDAFAEMIEDFYALP